MSKQSHQRRMATKTESKEGSAQWWLDNPNYLKGRGNLAQLCTAMVKHGIGWMQPSLAIALGMLEDDVDVIDETLGEEIADGETGAPDAYAEEAASVAAAFGIHE